MSAPRIALIHAVAAAIPPVQDAFAEIWPEAKVTNLYDDSLSPDREAETGDISPAMRKRIADLARYVAEAGAGGILYTCSAFGPAIEAVAEELAPLPVLKPNQAMFEEALSFGSRIGMIATFGPAVPPMEAEFAEIAGGQGASLETILVPGAIEALRRGDGGTHDRLVAETAPRLAHCHVVMLAHFSTSRALAPVQAALPSVPVLTAPRSAVKALRACVGSST